MITTALTVPTVLNWLCALFILFHSVNVISDMTPRTNHLIRLMYVLFCVGAFAVVVGPAFDVLADRWGEVLINLGVVLYCVADRRRLVPGGLKSNTPRGATPAH